MKIIMINNSNFIKIISTLFFIYFMAGMTSDRLGYLMTGSSIFIRMAIIFPIFTFSWYILIFFIKLNGVTIYKKNSCKFGGRLKNIKLISIYLFGFPILLAAFSWFTIGFSAWGSFFFASEPFKRDYIYTPDAYIAKGYKFRDALTGDRASVRVTTELYDSFPDEVSNFYSGNIVCLHGRTSVFGTIVSKIETGNCQAHN